MQHLVDDLRLPDRLHHFLLRMAGRLDDDALYMARELVAVLELDRAVELLLGCVVAGRIAITAGEQDHLRRLLEEVRSNPTLADDVSVVDVPSPDPHRFNAQSDKQDDLQYVLDRMIKRLPKIRSVWSTTRLTAAGATPGPVPQQVVLIEIEDDGHPSAVAYQMARAFAMTGQRVAVEAFRESDDLPDYHTKALASTSRVTLGENRRTSRERASSPSPRPAPSPESPLERDFAAAGEPASIELERPGTARTKAKRAASPRADSGAPSLEPPKASPVKSASGKSEPPQLAPVKSVSEKITPSKMPKTDAPTTEVAPVRPLAPVNDESPTGTVPRDVLSSAEADLSERERGLLQQLHQELIDREQQLQPPTKWNLAPPSSDTPGPNNMVQGPWQAQGPGLPPAGDPVWSSFLSEVTSPPM
jgi:hypothetical protein